MLSRQAVAMTKLPSVFELMKFVPSFHIDALRLWQRGLPIFAAIFPSHSDLY